MKFREALQRGKSWRFILLLVVASFTALLAVSQTVDAPSESYLERSMQRALLAFGTARALNGVISVAQGTQFALEPAGVGVNFSPGEILDPINDLVERFSWVMLLASSSLGVQKVLLSIAGWWPISALLVLTIALSLTAYWRGLWATPVVKQSLVRCLVLLAVLRFAIPLMSLGGELVYRQFLNESFSAANSDLEATRVQVDLLNDSLAAGNESELSLFSRLGGLASEVGDWRENLVKYHAVAETASRSTIDLIVVFVFQTVLMPLMFAWALLKGARGLVRWLLNLKY